MQLFFLFLSLFFATHLEATLFLRDSLHKAQVGDFIVTAQGKIYSLLHVQEKKGSAITIEEISVPSTQIPRSCFAWRDWAVQGAPGNSSWILYTIDLHTAQVQKCFSVTRNSWCEPQNNFISTLLNLPLEYIPPQQRRRLGSSLRYDRRIWQPQVIVDGMVIEGASLNAWKTIWPRDGSDLSGKVIEAYLPEEDSSYPSYFPYWLQISGAIGKARVRIVDSGKNLRLPRL